MTAALPLEEINAALHALTIPGLIAPDLAAPMVALLTDAARWCTAHPDSRRRQSLALAPGVLDLARALNARAAQEAL